MPPRIPKLPKLTHPLEPLREIVRGGRERLEEAGRDIHSIAEEFRGNIPNITSTIQDTEKAPEIEQKHPDEALLASTVPQTSSEETTARIPTACVPCALGHFAGAAKLLNEIFRFRDDGMESDQVLDDIAGAIGELNAMERVDLTPERLQKTPAWERTIADEALRESRKLRHRLEGIGSMEEVEKAAAYTETYYKKLNRQWYRGRFSNLGTKKAETIAQRVGEK